MKRIFNGRVDHMYSKEAYHKEKRLVLDMLEEAENTCVAANEELVQQSKMLKCWINGLIEQEPLWNSLVSLVTAKSNKQHELDDNVRLRGSSLSEIHSSVSFSTGRYDRMLGMIKQMSFMTLDSII